MWLYTSGSSGVPKGAEVTERNLLSLLAGAGRWDDSDKDDVWACVHAFTFDVSMWEMWRPLSVGAEVVVLPGAAQTGGALARDLGAAPRHHRAVPDPERPAPADRWCRRGTDGLRRLLVAGERLDFAALAPLRPAVAAGRLTVLNVYGPTEATIYALPTASQLTTSPTSAVRSSVARCPMLAPGSTRRTATARASCGSRAPGRRPAIGGTPR